MLKIHCKYDKLIPWRELKPHPKNRNKHPKEQIERLTKLIKYQGVRAPIVVSNLSGYIVKGHGTLDALKPICQEFNVVTVPVVFQDFEDDEQEYAFLQSDNAVAAWAELDLAGINADIVDIGPFDVELLGIKDFEVAPEDKYGDEDPDAVPEPPKEAKSKMGELWLLGNHRLLIDDCTDAQAVARLMGDEKADMVFTDPPYNMASENDLIAASVSRAMKRLKESEWDKDFDLRPALDSLYGILADDVTVYICTSHHLVGQIWEWIKAWPTRSSCDGYCVWAKPNPMPSLMKRHWTWSSELVCYATRGKHTFNFPEDGHALNVWSFTRKSDGTHPTQKPVEVCEHAITHSSKPGHIVADLFGGSGTTLIACEKLGRECRMSELDPIYGDVILTRFQKFSGIEPKREDGTPWSYIKDGGD